MAVRIVKVRPGLELELHFADHLTQEITRAMELVASVIAQAIAEDDVFVTGAILDGKGDKLWLGFYRHQGRFVREYCFVRSELLSFLQDGGWTTELNYNGYNPEFLEKLKRLEKNHRIW
ncbi:MAG: hypothetical protein P8074_04795 [Anaerolineales bacterium]|jgi:hypothetical protein